MDYNQITLIGHIGSDIRTFGEGDNAGAGFSMASNNAVKVNGEWADRPEWFRVSVFGKQSKFISEQLVKGSKVFVTGRLSTQQYEKDGKTLTNLEVRASQVIDLTPRPKVDDSGKAPF